jgi:hypothetical protein
LPEHENAVIDRRTTILGAAAIVTQFLALPALAGPRLPPHDKRAARAEFARILALFNAGDVAALLAYGPLQIIAGRKTLDTAELPQFLERMTSNNGRKDGAPIAIESFARMKRVLDRVIYQATIKRSAFFEEHCEDPHGLCRPEGHSPMYEFWRVHFDGPRIRLLEQLMVLA